MKLIVYFSTLYNVLYIAISSTSNFVDSIDGVV